MKRTPREMNEGMQVLGQLTHSGLNALHGKEMGFCVFSIGLEDNPIVGHVSNLSPYSLIKFLKFAIEGMEKDLEEVIKCQLH